MRCLPTGEGFHATFCGIQPGIPTAMWTEVKRGDVLHWDWVLAHSREIHRLTVINLVISASEVGFRSKQRMDYSLNWGNATCQDGGVPHPVMCASTADVD
jgi:hypothetical protein